MLVDKWSRKGTPRWGSSVTCVWTVPHWRLLRWLLILKTMSQYEELVNLLSQKLQGKKDTLTVGRFGTPPIYEAGIGVGPKDG